MDRTTEAGEAEFRAQQKQDEIERILAKVPKTEGNFVGFSGWYRNKNGNLVCETVLTVFSQHGRFNWVIAGGRQAFGEGGFETEELAKRDLWRVLQEKVN